MKSTKMMLIVALAAGALLADSSALLAQDSTNTPPAGGPPGGGMKGRGPSLERITKALDLTADQQPKVKAVLDDQMQKMRDLHNDPDFSSLSQDDRRAKMKTIRDETNAKLKDILTPDQFAKWQNMGPMGSRRNGGGGGKGGDTNAPSATPPKN
jgi:periplasmic protein CpxP/Spy